MVTPRPPWPARDGGQICMGQHIAHLAAHHECRLLCLAPAGRPGPEDLAALAPPGLLSVETVAHRPAAPARAWLASRLSRWPATLWRYRSAALVRRAAECVRAWRPDVAVLENLHLAYLCEAVPGVPWVIVQQNVETQFLESVARTCRPPRRWLYAAEARRMRACEPALLKTARALVALQEQEADWMRARVPGVPVRVVPIGVPDAPPTAPPAGGRRGFLLVGSLEWLPNRDAAAWLLRAVWPRVRERAPHAELTVVGRGAVSGAVAGEAAGVTWLGEVSEVGPHLARARASLVPLHAGAGLRVKILEALGAGTPVVTTPEGLGALPARSGEHLLVAAGEAEFAAAVLALDADPGLAARLGESGRAWVREHYSLRAVGEGLEAAMAVATGGRA
jgi:glycosyltransferase involved in cell wall biosynthesis